MGNLNQCNSGCRLCFTEEADMQQLAREHHNMKMRTESDQYTDTESDSAQETTQATHIDVQLDTKTIQLLTDMSPIGVATIHPSTNNHTAPPFPNTAHALSALSESANKESNIQQRTESPSKSEADLTDMSTMRVKNLSEILDPVELQEELEKQYDIHRTPYTPYTDEDIESSMDEAELAEIERRKSETLKTSSKRSSQTMLGPQLYKDDTNGTWLTEDMNNLRSDMEQQLVSLQSSKKLTKSDDQKQKPNVLRPKSAYKWDNDTLEQTKEQMQKQMMHLVMDKNSSGNVLTDSI